MSTHHQHAIQRTLFAPTLLLATSAALLALIAYADAKSTGIVLPQQQQQQQQPNTLLADIDNDDMRDNDLSSNDAANYDKRMERYAFGLGRRAYTYTNGGNGMKRLPVYNFGLGKRARPYSFGLGKRGEYDEDQYIDELLNGNSYGNSYGNGYDAAFFDEKRNRPYSFGLGKRSLQEPPPHRYGFGLGRR
ncbi:allatostatin-A [Zeugodacus cucurbitae]|nr:allatostatin-A [Zeugodacus cucurbitae]